MVKTRLDALLVERGLYESRSRAAAAVMAGEVRLGRDGARAPKPGHLVSGDVELEVSGGPLYVSRGGVKLAHGLDALGLDPRGRRCLDVGASTGGFTHCLLQRGAERVATVDVGYGELAWSLRQDARVVVLERTNARRLSPHDLSFMPDLVTLDLSFISLTKVLRPVMTCLAERFDAVAMVKPQFELGRSRVGRGGVVRDPAARREAIVSVATHAREQLGCAILGCASSGLPGPAGNRESFLWLGETGRGGALEDLEAAARRAEP